MGLFDNIFLDQNTATAMMDPLLEDPKAPSKPEEKNSGEAAVDAPVGSTGSTESSVDAVSFDDISSLDTKTSDQPQGFLSGGDPTVTEDVSFDIGGIDLGEFGSITTPTTDIVDTVTDSANMLDVTLEPVLDASIALVQGATSATSDAIMDITPETIGTSVDAITTAESDILLGVTQIEDQDDTLVQDDVTHTESDSASSTIMGSDNAVSSGGLMGLFEPDAETIIDPIALDTGGTSQASDNSIQVEDTTSLTSLVDPIVSSVSLMDATGTETNTHTVLSTDTTSIFTPSTSYSSNASPLHEMLTEFITKLEKFNAESETLDIEMTATEANLTEEREGLKREFDIRMAAIEYKRKHMEETRAGRKVEKSRLERIIANLKQEVV